MLHQYVERETGDVRTERIFADRLVNWLYSSGRERAPVLFRALIGARASYLLGYFNYDFVLGARLSGNRQFLRALKVDLAECVDAPQQLDSARKIFERKIRYWECRPMPHEPGAIVSPADAKVLVGTLRETSVLFIKDKFFSYEELLGAHQRTWLRAFERGDFAIFRLTPDMYHYNHTPVAGTLLDIYELSGHYHSCNPGAVITIATPYSKNKRTVTIIDTDVPGGTGVGLVAMIEVVALMIGEVAQVYSEEQYRSPSALRPGMFVRKGLPKSLYRPGSSTDVLLFQRNRIHFDADLVRNRYNQNAASRFSLGFGLALVETSVKVRSSIAHARQIK